MDRYKCNKICRIAAILNWVVQVLLLLLLVLLITLTIYFFFEFQRPPSNPVEEVIYFSSEEYIWELGNATLTLTANHTVTWGGMHAIRKIFTEGQIFMVLFLTSVAFSFAVLPSFFAARRLLAATKPGITFENAKENFNSCKDIFGLEPLALAISSGVVGIHAGLYAFVVLEYLPILSQYFAMLPMFFHMYLAEDYQRATKANEKVKGNIVTV